MPRWIAVALALVTPIACGRDVPAKTAAAASVPAGAGLAPAARRFARCARSCRAWTPALARLLDRADRSGAVMMRFR